LIHLVGKRINGTAPTSSSFISTNVLCHTQDN
jgi:hypothetical protein